MCTFSYSVACDVYRALLIGVASASWLAGGGVVNASSLAALLHLLPSQATNIMLTPLLSSAGGAVVTARLQFVDGALGLSNEDLMGAVYTANTPWLSSVQIMRDSSA